MNKWLELTIILHDYTKTNEVLALLIKPYIEQLYSNKLPFHWHFFREPAICWRIMSDANTVGTVKIDLDNQLTKLEQNQPDLYKEHYFGAFLKKDEKYTGEQELYGDDAWELCYKRWEAGSNLALLLCTTNPAKTLPFHYTRDIHLFENQLGFELSDAITIYLKWIRRLMECDSQYQPYIQTLDVLTAKTWKPSAIIGI